MEGVGLINQSRNFRGWLPLQSRYSHIHVVYTLDLIMHVSCSIHFVSYVTFINSAIYGVSIIEPYTRLTIHWLDGHTSSFFLVNDPRSHFGLNRIISTAWARQHLGLAI